MRRLLALLTLVPAPLLAIYVRADLEQVPLGRLLANAEARAEAAPEDPGAQHALARLHAMSYQWRLVDDAPVTADARETEPSFGYEPPWVPWTRERELSQPGVEADGHAAAGDEEARRHLTAAIAHYRRAVELAPEDPVIALGLAWCLLELDTAEATSEARSLLRAVIEVSAARELEQGGHLGPLLSVEAIDYLLPTLDPRADAAELERLRALRRELEALPRAITPIAVSLLPGLSPWALVDDTRPVRFDLDGSGRRLPWSWLRPEAAWLVWDRRGDGRIDSALQMFGSRSFGLFFEHGYQALALLDDDGDGALRGEELRDLALWHDRDADGESGPGEVLAVTDLGVVSIGCRATDRVHGVLGAPGSIERADGTRLDSWDLVLESRVRPAGLVPR